METYTQLLTELNEKIWNFSELKFQEHQSADAMAELLRSHGFTVTMGLADMDTAFTATYGSGKPVIGLLAEFDALSGLSQCADVTTPCPRPETENGHGCGHNLLGTACVGAALMLRDYLQTHDVPGTVMLLGCPAEEGGSGKTYLARAGVFDALDLALAWHPGGGNAVVTGSMQANCQAYFRFHGISSHAAATPHLGRSALDAVELMNVGANYMREHIESTDRLHYAITDSGGTSPNVVQNHAEVLYLIRSINSKKVQALYDRVCKIAQGAALMTETQVEICFDKACSNVLSNSVLEQLLYESMLAVPLPRYTPDELAFARAIQDTFRQVDPINDLSLMGVVGPRKAQLAQRYRELPMADFVVEHRHQEINIPGSSDVGDCSHVVPTAQFIGACFAPGTPAHSWQMVAQGKSGTAVKGMLYAAQVLAHAGRTILEHPALVQQAKAEFLERTAGAPYVCPIPPEILPNRHARP